MQIIIDEEFKMLLPSLDKNTFESLEKNILEYGVRDPLVLWNNILIDGYNRYNICTIHSLPFNTISMEFISRDEVTQWIIDNQISRRNLTSVELSHFRGLYYNAAKRIRGSLNQYANKSEIPQSGVKQKIIHTAKEVGERFNVSKNTINRDSMVANAMNVIAEISPEAKQKILSGEVPVDRNKLQKLSKAPKEEIEDFVTQINEGTYNRLDYRNKKDAEQTESNQYLSKPNTPETDYTDSITSLIAGNLNTTLKLLSNNSGIHDIKSSLKTLINSLEEIYVSINS